MRVAVLILAFSCWLCEAQADKNNDRVSLYPGSTSCSDTCSLTSISQTLGAVGEKVANMVGKITHLEEKLQNTGKEVLELRSLIKGKIWQMFLVGYNKEIYFFPDLFISSNL